MGAGSTWSAGWLTLPPSIPSGSLRASVPWPNKRLSCLLALPGALSVEINGTPQPLGHGLWSSLSAPTQGFQSCPSPQKGPGVKPRLPSLSRGDLTGRLEKGQSQAVLSSLAPSLSEAGLCPTSCIQQPQNPGWGVAWIRLLSPSFPRPGEKLWLLEGDLK